MGQAIEFQSKQIDEIESALITKESESNDLKKLSRRHGDCTGFERLRNQQTRMHVKTKSLSIAEIVE